MFAVVTTMSAVLNPTLLPGEPPLGDSPPPPPRGWGGTIIPKGSWTGGGVLGGHVVSPLHFEVPDPLPVMWAHFCLETRSHASPRLADLFLIFFEIIHMH